MKPGRGITRNGTISRRDGNDAMKIEAGGGNAVEIGRGTDSTGKGQREVGSDEIGRWQEKRERGDEESRWRRHLIVGRRDKGRRTVNEIAEELR